MITLSRSQLLLIALPLVALLALAGSRLASTGTSAGPRRAAPLAVVDAAPSAVPRVVVYVVGAVRRAGIYRLRDGARIADALRRAGGPTRRADLASVNLAAPVVDGQQIVVPARLGPGVSAGAGAAPGAGARVSLSAATVDQLDELPGVGPVTAQKIVDWRVTHPIRSVDDLDAIPGIGPARIEQLRDLVQP
jgi:competence protein ComEA